MDNQFLKAFFLSINDFLRRWNFRRHLALAYVSYWRSFLRSPHQVISTWTDGAQLGPRVAIFVHYDPDGIVQPFVATYVRSLHALGFSVVFVTNSGRLAPASEALLRPLCSAILIRRNIGYDFGAMRDGLRHAALPRDNTEMALIVNDSVYGPLGDMRGMVERIDFDEADVWGATESYQTRYHLQSFFIAVGRKALESKAWASFWKSVRPVRAKLWVILNYEVGMTRALLKDGLRCAAVYPYKELLARIDPTPLADAKREEVDETDPFVINRRTHLSRMLYSASHRMPMNPTAELWRQLLESGFPFLKRELLRDNPAGVIDVADWRDLTRDKFQADLAPIEHDLQRVLRDRTP